MTPQPRRPRGQQEAPWTASTTPSAPTPGAPPPPSPSSSASQPTGEPQAEMWMGAHPGAPSRLDRGAGPIALADVIDADPERELGAGAVGRVRPPAALPPQAPRRRRSPLSLQVHPDLAQAEGGLRGRGAPRRPDRRRPPQLQGRQPQARADLRAHPLRRPVRLPRTPPRPPTSSTGLGVDSLKPYVDILHAHPGGGAPCARCSPPS